MTLQEKIHKSNERVVIKKLNDCYIENEVAEKLKEHATILKYDMKELKQYRTIGTVEECREAINKQISKTPSHKYIKYGKHKWQRDEDGEIDDWSWDYEYCNGVTCKRCGKQVCVHCNPNYDKLEDCEVNIYNCPSCNKNVYRNQKYCDCGQKLDWKNQRR